MSRDIEPVDVDVEDEFDSAKSAVRTGDEFDSSDWIAAAVLAAGAMIAKAIYQLDATIRRRS